MGNDDFVGQACLPIWEMRSGIRCVALSSKSGTLRTSKLLCHFQSFVVSSHPILASIIPNVDMKGPSTSTNTLSFLPNPLVSNPPNKTPKEPMFDGQEGDAHDGQEGNADDIIEDTPYASTFS